MRPDTTSPKLPVEFRPVTANDADDLATLRVQAMRPSLERAGRFDPERARRRFLDTFSPGHTREIAQGDVRVGFFVVKPDAGGLALEHLYILPAHQGRGLGAAVLQHVFGDAERQGLAVRVGALKGSDSNRFYLRHGFVLESESAYDNHYVRRSCTPWPSN